VFIVFCFFDIKTQKIRYKVLKTVLSITYQLDLVTPGNFPCEARFRKQIRQIPNFLKKALGLPQIGHLLYPLTLNLGFLFAFILSAFFAKSSSFFS